jgi:hypothetical protein
LQKALKKSTDEIFAQPPRELKNLELEMQANQLEGSFCDFKSRYLPCLQKILSTGPQASQQSSKEIEYIIANTPPMSEAESESESSEPDLKPADIISPAERKMSRVEWAKRQL